MYNNLIILWHLVLVVVISLSYLILLTSRHVQDSKIWILRLYLRISYHMMSFQPITLVVVVVVLPWEFAQEIAYCCIHVKKVKKTSAEQEGEDRREAKKRTESLLEQPKT